MARRRIKLFIASAGRGFQLNLAQGDWARLEKVYEHPLPDPLRANIVEITNRFLSRVEFEETAPEIKEAEDYISTVRNSVRELSRAIRGRPGLDIYKARQLLLEHADLPAVGDNDGITHLAWHTLPSLARACDSAKSELSELGAGSFRTGGSWEVWTVELTKLLRAQGLPTGARKDASPKSGKTIRDASPFVELVWKLQECIPFQFRRATQSREALAAMVTKARSKHVKKSRQ